MTLQTGAGSKVVLGYQSDIDTVATEGFVLAVNSSSLNATRTQNTAQTIRGNMNPVEPFEGNLSASGSITVPVDSIQLWYLLKAAFGDPTTSGTGPYSHVFKAGNARPFLTVEHQFTELATDKFFRYRGCKINSMALSQGQDGELVATFDVVAANRTIETSAFDASPTSLGFARLKNNQMTLKEGGSAMSNAKMVDMTVNFNCDTSQYVIGGGGILGAIPDGVMGVSGKVDALFEDTTLLEKAINATESKLESTFTGSASSALSILLPELKYTPADPGIDGPQGLAVSLAYNAYYTDAVEATSVQITLTNSEAHA
ncbi:MAG TPA: hypothetical protein DHV36_16160 [Desulfobacteraceae bacterium]|nr:hypothetical protein [Desulfobacteraceae bacterium]